MEKHYVKFFGPGTFFTESEDMEIESWDVEKAKELAPTIFFRYNSRPAGFRFYIRERSDTDFDPKITKYSPFYYLGGQIRTAEEVLAGTNPDEDILRTNIRNQGVKRIIENNNSFRFTAPLNDDDVVLDFTMPPAIDD